MGFRFWTMSATLTTTRCTLLFRNLVGFPLVSSEFLKYRDSFLFALAVHWGVNVLRYDLSPEQSQAAFSFVDYPSNVARNSAAGNNSGSGATPPRDPEMQESSAQMTKRTSARRYPSMPW